MSRQLPSHPNLRHLKNEAKELHKALGRGDASMGVDHDPATWGTAELAAE